MTAIILAGGKASRMGGSDKAFLKIGKYRLIDIQLRSLKKIFKQIIVVTNYLQRYRNLKGVELVSDIIPDIGPLGGIYSGLMASGSFYNFVLACDMPFINAKLIKYMRKKTSGYDAVVPWVNNRYEPLCALYSKRCIATIKEAMDKDNLRIVDILAFLNVKSIDESEIKKFDPEFVSFKNINTEEDYHSISP